MWGWCSGRVLRAGGKAGIESQTATKLVLTAGGSNKALTGAVVITANTGAVTRLGGGWSYRTAGSIAKATPSVKLCNASAHKFNRAAGFKSTNHGNMEEAGLWVFFGLLFFLVERGFEVDFRRLARGVF